jgi:hypothetical protein
MGMFDSYVPQPALQCPRCHGPLAGFQGKDGPNALFVWTQGTAAPSYQTVDDEWQLPPEKRSTLRLPPRFETYTRCDHCQAHVDVTGFCEDGVWTRCVFGRHLRSTAISARRIDARWRQCSRCAEAWEEDPEMELSGCPGCGALTELT